MTETYKIQRLYFKGWHRTLKRGLTLEQAQAHCTNPETSSSTCQRPENKQRTRKLGAWFDSYTEE